MNRAALLFGPNGSGKSTIAQGFREYIDPSIPRSVEISPMCGNTHWVLTPGARPEKIFVFDEAYVERSVKIQSSGLDAIVLFGEQVQLEQQIQAITQDIEQKTILMHQQEEDNKKYTDPNNVNSPQYWVLSITKTLQAPGGWAETAGIKIKRNRTSSRVNEIEVDRLGALQPAKTEAETEAEFAQTFTVFSSISAASQPISTQIRQIAFSGDIEVKATSLLATPLQRPVLTQRESDLLDMFGMKVISDARGFLINPAYTTCPVCLQPISDEYRADTIQRIECILNRDVEDFRHKLWDHLAIMSDFKLDIDYPFQVVKPEELVVKPETIEYPQKYIRYRHYGRFLGELIEKAMTIEDEQERKRLINLLANQMKKSFANWNKDGVEDQKIVDDLREYSNGAIDLKVEDLKFNHVRTANNNGQRKQNNQRRQNNNQRRKY